MSASFSTTYAQFIAELKLTFPEFLPALIAAESASPLRFVELWAPYTADIASHNSSIFTTAGIQVVPGVTLTAALWAELGAATRSAIWNYISSLVLLAAADKKSETEGSGLWDLSGFKANMEAMMKSLSESSEGSEGTTSSALPEGFASLFEKLAGMASGMAGGMAGGAPDVSGAKPAFKIPERLFKGHIAKIAEELVREFKPEEFGIDAALLESKDPAHVFTYLQEIFTKRPEMMMSAAQKIGKRLQTKFARGEINRDEIIREAEELMKEFSENEAFSSLFGSLGEMFKGGEKESGHEGSARRREVQERLRKKQAERQAARTMPTTNVVVNAAAVAAADAATAELIAEEASIKTIKPVAKKAHKK